jgi:hypothetical protein
MIDMALKCEWQKNKCLPASVEFVPFYKSLFVTVTVAIAASRYISGQCYGSKTIFFGSGFGSGSHFPLSLGSGSGSYLTSKKFKSTFGCDSKYSLFLDANDFEGFHGI